MRALQCRTLEFTVMHVLQLVVLALQWHYKLHYSGITSYITVALQVTLQWHYKLHYSCITFALHCYGL